MSLSKPDLAFRIYPLIKVLGVFGDFCADSRSLSEDNVRNTWLRKGISKMPERSERPKTELRDRF